MQDLVVPESLLDPSDVQYIPAAGPVLLKVESRESTGTVLSTGVPSSSVNPPESLPAPASDLDLMSIVIGTGSILAGIIITASVIVIMRARNAR